MPQTLERVLAELRPDVPSLSSAIRDNLGLTHQNTDWALAGLEAAGLARKLGRTAGGFEWIAQSGYHGDDRP